MSSTGMTPSWMEISVSYWDDTFGHCRHKGTSACYSDDRWNGTVIIK
ncbi:hypothetical protein [Wolbachia endosymbiont (group A) of Bibio marci]|nr:hypothetical protein [Wolbachia endosymbiont (group A) of Bibio marci]